MKFTMKVALNFVDKASDDAVMTSTTSDGSIQLAHANFGF
jgi:hypothetical protein